MSNKTNHPPHRGPYKDPAERRTTKRTFDLTATDNAALQAKCEALGISKNEFLARAIRLDSSLFKC